MTDISPLRTSLADRYEIDREIGAGGMATVYLARDVRHDRKVALKVLNPELGAVLGVERFLAEIKVTANLQHPNLLPLFDSGEAGGLLFYVMPFVEGESLRVRLEREKQFPVDEAIRISVAIANALDYAHGHGVIHRDLKPENILLQHGQPVVADFGIALAVSKAGGQRITQTGLSLGTPQYMSPEQATGDRVIDARSDVYSLAAMTYEMLTGEPPHIGNTAQAIIARVLTDKPRSIRSTRSAVPEHVEGALERALEKLPADRFSSAREFAEALQGRGAVASRAGTEARTAAQRVATAGWRARLRDPVVLGLAAVAIAAVAMAIMNSRPPVTAADALRPIRFVVTVGDSMQQGVTFPWPAAISPDGGTLVFSMRLPGKEPMLFLRRSDQIEPQAIAGTEGAFQPIFSPDGQWLAFEIQGREKKVRLDGSAPVNISSGGNANGADWTVTDELVLGASSSSGGLEHVSAAGGERVVLTVPDSAHGERQHLWPIAFPDGKTVAFILWYGDLATARLALTSLDDGKVVRLDLKSVRPLAVLDGMLLFVQADGAVMAVPVDAATKRIVGSPVPVHDPIRVWPGNNGNSDVFVSRLGALVTVAGSDLSQLGWLDRNRAFHPLLREERNYYRPRLSPDGRRVATMIGNNQQVDAWVLDLGSSTMSKVTTNGAASCVEWTSGGERLLIAEGQSEFWEYPARSAAPPRRLARSKEYAFCGDLAPDGRMIMASALTSTWDLWAIPVDSTVPQRSYVATSLTDWVPKFSPDGKWIAFESDVSGAMEIYVRSFPDPTARVQVSAGGGSAPRWSRDGKSLTYIAGDAFVRARTDGPPAYQVLSRDTLMLGAAESLIGGTVNYDLSLDGTRVLTTRPTRRGTRMIAVPNWIVEFRERVRLAARK